MRREETSFGKPSSPIGKKWPFSTCSAKRKGEDSNSTGGRHRFRFISAKRRGRPSLYISSVPEKREGEEGGSRVNPKGNLYHLHPAPKKEVGLSQEERGGV